MATASGVVQAVFPEGGLTRDGRLRAPKLGLISYMVQGFDPRGARDIVFVPVGVNYDRVLEDRTMIAAANGMPNFRAHPGRLAFAMLKGLWLGLRGRWIRLGTAAVVFGRPQSLRNWCQTRRIDLRTLDTEQRETEISALGHDLMAGVASAIPALPVSLVATALIEAGDKPQTMFELKGRVFDLMQRIERNGGLVVVPRHDQDAAVEAGLRQLQIRHIVAIGRDGVTANSAERAVLQYYANAIAHHLGAAALPSDIAA
jgi:glycerol-3-phosphate O-acyltransferase